jgi:hypothetical protein
MAKVSVLEQACAWFAGAQSLGEAARLPGDGFMI